MEKLNGINEQQIQLSKGTKCKLKHQRRFKKHHPNYFIPYHFMPVKDV